MLKIPNFEKCRQDSPEVLYFYSSSDATSAEVRVQFHGYIRGTVIYVDQPARIADELRRAQSTSAVPMPHILNHALRGSMRSFLKDAKEYLPTTIKPDCTERSFQKRLAILRSKKYHSVVAWLKKESILNEWLWGLELPDHEDLWDEMRFVFFTGDGQIGLSFEKPEVGDLVIELDRRTAESLVLRKSGDLYTLVTISIFTQQPMKHDVFDFQPYTLIDDEL
jgi:hypothetical protein